MPKFYRKKPASKKPLRKKRTYKKRMPKMAIQKYPSFIKAGQLPRHAYSDLTFGDVITIDDATTESAAFLRYYANFIDTVAGAPTGCFVSKSSTPGTNDPFTSIRTDPIPRGFDEMNALYNTIRVYASSITVQYMNQSAAATGNTAIGLYTNDDDQSFTTPTDADEVIGNTIPGFHYKVSYPTRGPMSNPLIKHFWSEKYLTKQDRVANQFQYGDNFDIDGNGPKNYYNIPIVNMFSQTADMTGRIVVRIHYKCKWSDPKSFASDDIP